MSAAPGVVVIEPVGGHGGMHYYDQGLCRGVGAAGLAVVLHTCDRNPPPSEPGRFEVRASFTGVYGSDAAWRRALRYLRALVGALAGERRRGRALAHLHFFHVGPLELAGALLARAFGYRLVVTAHDVESFQAGLEVQWMARRAYALAHAVIAHNRSSAAEVRSRLGVAAKRLHVVPHGSYLDFVGGAPSREAARRRLGLPAGPVVLFFGQIKEVKGLDLLIEAVALRPEVQLVIAGRPWKDPFDRYEAQIRRLGIEHRVQRHLRYIPDAEVADFYAAADLVVLPYRRIYQSGVLLMAMSHGTPVVASDLPAMAEVVRDGENGFLFERGSAADLARVLGQALADPLRLQRIAAAARADMHERFGWAAIGERTAEVYRAALAA